MVMMNTPAPTAPPSGPALQPQPIVSFVQFPPQTYGNPQPWGPPSPRMPPMQCWGCGQFGHMRNQCPQNSQYQGWATTPGVNRRGRGNFRGGHRGGYQQQSGYQQQPQTYGAPPQQAQGGYQPGPGHQGRHRGNQPQEGEEEVSGHKEIRTPTLPIFIKNSNEEAPGSVQDH